MRADPLRTTRRRKATAVLLVGVVVLAGCSSTITIEDKPGATLAQAQADHEICHDMVKREPDRYVPAQNSVGAAAAAGAVVGVMSVVQEERAVDVCMAQLGYVDRTLTPDETSAVRAVPKGPARTAVVDRIMKANDPVSQDAPDATD